MKQLLLLTFLLIITLSNVQAQSVELPNSCKKILDKNYQGWKLAVINKDITDYLRKNNLPSQANIAKGDWNGDGKFDYAALVEREKSKNADRRLMIIFVRAGSGYKYFSFDGVDYIQPMKKGSKDYDYETGRTFRYQTDAVFAGFWEKGGTSYIWKKNKFTAIITSD